MNIDKTELKALAEAFPDDLDWDSNQTPFFNGPSGESLGGGADGTYAVYGKPFFVEGDDYEYDGPTYVERCSIEFAKFMVAARDGVLNLIAENSRLIEDRARFPDRPDDIGSMIGCHIGNLKSRIESAESYSRRWSMELSGANRKLDAANSLLQEFCDRVDRGEVRSNKSYAKFKAHLSACKEPTSLKCAKCGAPFAEQDNPSSPKSGD